MTKEAGLARLRAWVGSRPVQLACSGMAVGLALEGVHRRGITPGFGAGAVAAVIGIGVLLVIALSSKELPSWMR